MKPALLILIAVAGYRREPLAERFDLIDASSPSLRTAVIASEGHRVRMVLTNGTVGCTAAEMDGMPGLTLVCALGAGYENVAVEHATSRGITVVNGAGTNASCVADHALALVLATVRGIPRLDRHVRDGDWRDAIGPPPGLTGMRLGVVGLGSIGRKIALRAAAFEMVVGYHSRTARPDAPWPYLDTVGALAGWADILVVATPGGAATRHLIDAAVLGALGPRGYLINIARSSVVDTAALAEALEQHRIAGAGLDVYEGEPAPPVTLCGFDNVVLTPHVGGWSPQAGEASLTMFLDNARRHLNGDPVLTPVTAGA